ncbi:hypothetical protein KR018_004552 [Drosophila ironensis]|nr:hypothetical protein KR018_004552 [Drosophila ironensis]
MLPKKSDSRRRLNAGTSSYPTVDYVKVEEKASREEIDGFVHEQWQEPPLAQSTPWKTILLILTLFTGGLICIGFATRDWLAEASQERSDRMWALGIIGTLTFIPGGYYMFVLSCILLNRQGFTMDDIRRLG